jgi:hypothetical protein
MIRHRWQGHSWPSDCLTTLLLAVVFAAVSLLPAFWLYLEVAR